MKVLKGIELVLGKGEVVTFDDSDIRVLDLKGLKGNLHKTKGGIYFTNGVNSAYIIIDKNGNTVDDNGCGKFDRVLSKADIKDFKLLGVDGAVYSYMSAWDYSNQEENAYQKAYLTGNGDLVIKIKRYKGKATDTVVDTEVSE